LSPRWSPQFRGELNLYLRWLRLDCSGIQACWRYAGLEVLTSWWVVGPAGVVRNRVFADRFPPRPDLECAARFIRVPVAALLAYRATATLSPRATLTAAGQSLLRPAAARQLPGRR
jgi:hypothetical protein